MNVIVNSQTFAHELRALDKIAATKSTIPVLMNVLIKTNELSISMTATDLEVGMRAVCPANVFQPGEITLPVKKLLALIEQIPNCEIRLVLDEKQHVTLSAGKFKSRLQTLPAADYPTVPVVDLNLTKLNGPNLREMINRVRYAIASDGKYTVDGALLSLTNGVAACVGSDSKRLSVATSAYTGNVVNVIIPSKTLDVLLAQNLTGDIEFSQSERHIFFLIGDRIIFSRMLETKFPAYARIIPTDHDKICQIDRVPFAAILRRVGVVNESIYLTISPKSLSLKASNVEFGDAVDEMLIDYDGPEVTVYVDWKQVLDFLDASTSTSITMALKDKNSPLLMTDGAQVLNVILGKRV